MSGGLVRELPRIKNQVSLRKEIGEWMQEKAL
jgi:hypothetical protein